MNEHSPGDSRLRPRQTRPTITDVAREAGVGLGTASRALSGHARVAEATRQRVVAAAKRLGYQPSGVARAFSKRRTHALELVIPFIGRYLFLEILRGVEEALTDTDYSLVIRSVEQPSERERVFDACCMPGRADGVLIVAMRPPERLAQRLTTSGFPAV